MHSKIHATALPRQLQAKSCKGQHEHIGNCMKDGAVIKSCPLKKSWNEQCGKRNKKRTKTNKQKTKKKGNKLMSFQGQSF